MLLAVRFILSSAALAGWAWSSEELEATCTEYDAACPDPTSDRGLFQTKSIKAQQPVGDESAVSLGQLSKPVSAAEWKKALGPGIDVMQMKQGDLGDCYFLSGLAAIANQHKDILENMFKKGELMTGNQVYTTEWLINGKRTVVAVNDKVPADPAFKDVWFANGKNGAMWIAVLEKAWAKIFGSYQALDGGRVSEAFKAITQAPVEKITHQNIQSKAAYWQDLLTWSESKFPMSASTGATNSIGIPNTHAYTVLEVFVHPGNHPKRVRIYNPHGQDNYRGVLPNNNKKDGTYVVTFDEFVDNFDSCTVARVRKGSVVSEKVLSRKTQSTVVLEFDMATDKPFSVQFEWPSGRFMKKGCQPSAPEFTVAVAKKGSLESFKLMRQVTGMTNARVDLPGKQGKYVVFVNAHFPNWKSWLQEFVINVYGPPTQLVPSTGYANPIDLFLQMQGLCRTIVVPNAGRYVGRAGVYSLDERTKVNGMPVFRAKLNCHPQFSVIVWDAVRKQSVGQRRVRTMGTNEWKISDSTEEAARGALFGVKVLPGAKCSNSLLQQNQPSSADVLAEALPTEEPEKSLVFDEQGIQQESIVEMAEVETDDQDLEGDNFQSCGRMVERLSWLGKASSIASSGVDDEFPATQRSIGTPGTSLGDAAVGINEDCAKFNNWESLVVIEDLRRECAKDCRIPGCVGKKIDRHGRCLVDFRKCSPPIKYGNSGGWYTIGSKHTTMMRTNVCKDPSYKALTPGRPPPTPTPTPAPALKPVPTPVPTSVPTLVPTLAPTMKPTPVPTLAPTLAPTSAAIISKPVDCKDKSSSCSGWAAKKYCTVRYAGYMKTNCPKSCGFCVKPCKDGRSNCPRWVQLGYCTGKYANFMRKNCAKSCSFC